MTDLIQLYNIYKHMYLHTHIVYSILLYTVKKIQKSKKLFQLNIICYPTDLFFLV